MPQIRGKCPVRRRRESVLWILSTMPGNTCVRFGSIQSRWMPSCDQIAMAITYPKVDLRTAGDIFGRCVLSWREKETRSASVKTMEVGFSRIFQDEKGREDIPRREAHIDYCGRYKPCSVEFHLKKKIILTHVVVRIEIDVEHEKFPHFLDRRCTSFLTWDQFEKVVEVASDFELHGFNNIFDFNARASFHDVVLRSNNMHPVTGAWRGDNSAMLGGPSKQCPLLQIVPSSLEAGEGRRCATGFDLKAVCTAPTLLIKLLSTQTWTEPISIATASLINVIAAYQRFPRRSFYSDTTAT